MFFPVTVLTLLEPLPVFIQSALILEGRKEARDQAAEASADPSIFLWLVLRQG